LFQEHARVDDGQELTMGSPLIHNFFSVPSLRFSLLQHVAGRLCHCGAVQKVPDGEPFGEFHFMLELAY
jgi:hypothetical protein